MIVWPLRPGRTAGCEGLTRLVRYVEGHRIDFQIEETGCLDLEELDNGYRVLLDKDGLTTDLPVPSLGRFIIRRPSSEEYLETVNAFWWDALYVPKCLARQELPYASFMLDCQLRNRFLNRMIEWYIGSRNGWSVATGVHGRYFRDNLDGSTWKEYLSTFPSGCIADHWRSFFALLLLFRRLAVSVAEALGYGYPDLTDAEASGYCMDLFGRN
jgi:aminoglycoside 6-adenylyltransferase